MMMPRVSDQRAFPPWWAMIRRILKSGLDDEQDPIPVVLVVSDDPLAHLTMDLFRPLQQRLLIVGVKWV